MSTGVPFDVKPKRTQSFTSESARFISSKALSPARWRISSAVCLRWLPRANTRVTSFGLTPAEISSSKRAGITL